MGRFAEAVDADVSRIIGKPFEQDRLLDAVAELIDDKAASPS